MIAKVLYFPRKFHSWFKSISWKKKIIVIVVIIILLSIVVGQIGALTAPPGYTLAKAERTDIKETVTETGRVSSNGNVEIYSPTNGIVKEIYVANGDIVIENQNLLNIESNATEQEQKAAYANYLTAVATLNAAKSNLDVLRADMYGAWDSFRDLATNGEYEDGENRPREENRQAAEFQISQDQWQAAEAKYKDQQTVVGQAGVAVSSTWLLYQATQDAVVKATTNGTIANLAVTGGSPIKAQTVTNASSPILNIAKPGTTEVKVSLSETDISKVKDGQEAVIDVSSIDGKEFKGIVRRVDTIGTDDMGVIRYNVYIEITNPDTDLRSGMTADVEIVTNQITDVLSVPNSAVKPYQGGRAVRVINPSTKAVEYVPVEIGIRGEDRTQILKGLDEGQEIVTSLSNEQIQRSGLF